MSWLENKDKKRNEEFILEIIRRFNIKEEWREKNNEWEDKDKENEKRWRKNEGWNVKDGKEWGKENEKRWKEMVE